VKNAEKRFARQYFCALSQSDTFFTIHVIFSMNQTNISFAELTLFFKPKNCSTFANKPVNCSTLQSKPKLLLLFQGCTGGSILLSKQATVTGAQTSSVSPLSTHSCSRKVRLLVGFFNGTRLPLTTGFFF